MVKAVSFDLTFRVMKLIRTSDDLQKALKSQLRALTASCVNYDSGAAWEAARMAVAVHALVHDGGKKNVSILSQLKIRDRFPYLASGHPIHSDNILASTPLVMLQMDRTDVRYVPHLNNGPNIEMRYVSFHEWWARDLIFQSGKDSKPFHTFSRRRLVFALRNKEGAGAHYDAEIDDEAYIAISTQPQWMATIGKKEYPVLQLELASMRQVAWEFLETLKQNGIEP